MAWAVRRDAVRAEEVEMALHGGEAATATASCMRFGLEAGDAMSILTIASPHANLGGMKSTPRQEKKHELSQPR